MFPAQCPAHVCPLRSPKPPPLRSTRVTRLHRYYGRLRLPSTDARPLAFQAWGTGAHLRVRQLTGLPGCRFLRLSGSIRPQTPGRRNHPRLRGPSAVACWRSNAIGRSPTSVFRGSTPSRAASPVPSLDLACFQCLRINRPVAGTTARLDTRPVASGYLERVHTSLRKRPCQAAT